MKKQLKLLVAWLICRLGIFRLFLFFRRHRVTILVLHGVMDDGPDQQWSPAWKRHTTKQVELGLKTLSRYFNFVSIEDAVKMLKGEKPVVPYSMALTFDDGYENNLTHAYPIAKKYSVPCCFYLATYYSDHIKPFWLDRLDYALQQLKFDEIELRTDAISKNVKLKPRAEYEETYRKFRLALKDSYRDDEKMLLELNELAKELESKSGKSIEEIIENDEWAKPLSKDQIKQIPVDITLGSHTVHHWRVINTDNNKLKDEFSESKKFIENLTNRRCDHFCYPNGDHNETAVQALQECGYVSAVTTDKGSNRVGDNIYKLKRISFPNQSASELLLVNLMRMI